MKGVKVFAFLAVLLMVVGLSGCMYLNDNGGSTADTATGDTTTGDTTTDTAETIIVEPEVSEGSVVEGAVQDYDYEGYEDPYTAENLKFDFHTPLPGKVGDTKLVSWYFNTELEHYGGVIGLDITETTLYYGYESVSDEDVSKEAYPYSTETYSGSFIDDASYDEGSFSDYITYEQEGRLYMRAYAVVNGHEVWTEERYTTVFAADEE